MTLHGYRRADGRIGFRNHLAVIPASVCASVVCDRIAEGLPGAVALSHQHGCCQMGDDFHQTVRSLAGMGRNPNVAAALVVALGCEGVQAADLAGRIAATDKPVHTLIIQENEGTARTVEKGRAVLAGMAESLRGRVREPVPLSALVLGMECGGSDATSGIVTNPIIGRVSDRLIAAGGVSILSETTEMIGAEHILARRARSRTVAERFLGFVQRTEQRALKAGQDIRGSQPTPGNIAGGISSIEEKSLGCLGKAGSSPLEGVLEYGEEPPGKGLHFMDTPGQDIESITGMVAGGAQAVVFSTGRGTPTGCPIAPVIKITGNDATYRAMRNSIDINAGRAISANAPLDAVADELFAYLVQVCSGELTAAERDGHREFAIYRVGYTY